LEAYGNRNTWITPPIGGADPSFLNGDGTWKSTLTELNTAQFFQVRISLISNATTNLNPEVSALGFAYRR
jgi:hypothetical protein